MYTEESTRSLIEQVLDIIEFEDLSTEDYREASRVFINLRGDLK